MMDSADYRIGSPGNDRIKKSGMISHSRLCGIWVQIKQNHSTDGFHSTSHFDRIGCWSGCADCRNRPVVAD